MALVYRHRRLDDFTIFYVGIELDSINKTKLGKRPYIKSGKSKWWKNIVNKTNYCVEIVSDNLTNLDAIELEIFLIKEYGRANLGEGLLVNLTDGGEGTINVVVSEETRLKNAAAARITNNRKGKKASLEERRRLSELHKGNKYCLGVNRSEETKRKISEAQKGRILSEEWKNNISKSLKGRKISEKNKQITIERKSIKVICTETNVIFNSMKDLSEFLGFSRSYISNMLNNKIENITSFIILDK